MPRRAWRAVFYAWLVAPVGINAVPDSWFFHAAAALHMWPQDFVDLLSLVGVAGYVAGWGWLLPKTDIGDRHRS